MDLAELRQKMGPGYLVDPDSDVAQCVFALIQPYKKGRKRFPENCVQVQPDREAALAAAQAGEGRGQSGAAVVYGPCRSSEGLRLYYLVEWLEAGEGAERL